MKNLIITGILLGYYTFTFGQETWSYQECISYAWENNLNLRNENFDTRRQQLNYASAKHNFLPSVSGEVGYDQQFGRSTDPTTNDIIDKSFSSNSYRINASLLLFNGFRQQNQLKYEKYRFLSAKSSYEKQKNDVAFKVIDSYINHLINTGVVAIRTEQLDISQKEVHRIQKSIELGLASKSDLYDAEARMAEDEYKLIRSQNQANRSENDLKSLMNLAIDTTLVLNDITIDELLTEVSYDSLVRSAQTNLPEIKSTYALLTSAQKQVSAARAALSPSLYTYFNWNTGYYETNVNSQTGEIYPFNEQFRNNRNINVGLSLQVPIFDKFSRRNRLQEAKISRDQAENELELTLSTMDYEVNQALLDWKGAVAEYKSGVKGTESIEQAFIVAEKKREKGLIGIMEYYEAKNRLAEAKAEQLRTELQLFLMEKTIRYYLTGSYLENYGQED